MKTFGQNPKGARLKRIKNSPNYKDGIFHNAEPTEIILKSTPMRKMLWAQLHKPKTITPSQPVPFVTTDLKNLDSKTPKIVWFGHSSYLIVSQGFTILVDPVFSGYASPIPVFGHPFPGANTYDVEDFPDIDLLVITHDHYDHLDYPTIGKLKDKVKRIVTPLGVGAHLEYWGLDAGKITELDWWEGTDISKDVHLTATPSRHFSGRTVVRFKTLWASFVLSLHGRKIFLGGDSGYDSQFKLIGERFGPFDLAMLDGAQYWKDWPKIHMVPEETIQAALDLRAKHLLPVHWGKFALSFHDWNEPIKRLLKAAEKTDLQVMTPMIGEVTELDAPMAERKVWWDFI